MRIKFAQAGILAMLSLLLCEPAYADGFVGSGLLHPLTGRDHMLAMIAEGGWSAQRYLVLTGQLYGA